MGRVGSRDVVPSLFEPCGLVGRSVSFDEFHF